MGQLSKQAPFLRRICCTGAVLALMLMALRAKLAFSRSDLRSPRRLLGALGAIMYQDIAYVAGLTALFIGLCLLTGHRHRMQRLNAAVFAAAACISLAFGFINVRAVAELGQPINYQWLYYSNFMRSLDTYTALSALVSWKWAGTVAIGCLVLLLAAYGMSRGALWKSPNSSIRQVRNPAVGALVAYLALGWSCSGVEWSPAKVRNPVVAMLTSFLDAEDNPVLARMPTAFGAQDFMTAAERGAVASKTPYTARARDAGVRNVLVIVLESVGAHYVSGFGAASPEVTPELQHYQRWARRFPNFYAHQPSTTHSLIALLLSAFPPHSFRAVTREHPDIALPSISGALRQRGYRTAFLNAYDNRFQAADLFLSHREFDLVSDALTGSCIVSTETRPDECMFGNLMQWISRDSLQPFFAVAWTAQTHFPYLASRSPFGQKIASRVAPSRAPTEYLNVRFTRYLRALHETDRALGRLFRLLEQRGLLDSTLIVILGDHGEAFGQHGHMFHRLLYEEEVRIPLLLVNRRLFHGEVDSVLGGTVDVASTVMDLLGEPLPGEWQGRSLFDPERSGRVYLFGPYSGLFSFREGSRKLIYNPIANASELYDLSADPQEMLNLAGENPELVRSARERLAAWVQYQEGFYRTHGVSR